MERKRNNLFFAVLGVLVVLLILAGFKTLDDHHEKEYQVIHYRILEAAKECFLKGDCEGEITVKDLYDKDYLKKQIDPVTKEDFDATKCIKFEKNEAKFCE